jgi:hypothetical protein
MGVPARPSEVWLGVAFVADVESVAQFAPGDYRVEMTVERVYRGDVPDHLDIQVFGAGCTVFQPSGLTLGDRVFFALDKLSLPENSSLSGPLVIWRKTSTGWAFADDALRDSFGTLGPQYWSKRLRSSDSLSDILAAISGMPNTATESGGAAEDQKGIAGLFVWLAGLVAFAFTFWRTRPGSRHVAGR